MTGTKFKYRLDKRARLITWCVPGVIVLTIALLWIFSPGGYWPAWFTSVAVAVGALVALSIPRSIRVTKEAVEIRCLVEITHITYNHFRSVRRMERADLKPFIPTFASVGVGGYFGYWLDIKNWDLVKVYASSWQGLVLIEDIYEQKYLVSVDDPEKLIETINKHLKIIY